jgi:beta-mannosidase
MVSSPEATLPGAGGRSRVGAHDVQRLDGLWRAAPQEPGAPMPAPAGPHWIDAPVPGTAAGALARAGQWRPGTETDLDSEDWWFCTSFDADDPVEPHERLVLQIGGVATIWEASLNGLPIAAGTSMFETAEVDISKLVRQTNELVIACRSLAAELATPRRPRARWRTRLVADNGLRFHRTMLLGRLPGIAPGPAPVGPWRGVTVSRRRLVELCSLSATPSLRGADGLLQVAVTLQGIGDANTVEAVTAELERDGAIFECDLDLAETEGTVAAAGAIEVPDVARWWPHTHGEPALYRLRLRVRTARGQTPVDCGTAGFRELASGGTVEEDGMALAVNGTPVFARGAVWTPPDPIGLSPDPGLVEAQLEEMRDAGMNMVRIPGTGAYETTAFHDACDRLGILVWQDLLFANMDYPAGDPQLRQVIEREVRDVLASLHGRPSLAVVCGNSEVDQQVAMLGLDRELARGDLFGDLIPSLVGESRVDAVFVPSAPCGGDQPFRPGSGVGTYYGVGCYELGLEDARRADVRFAAECLAFSHVPGEEALAEIAPGEPTGPPGGHPLWKAGIPREHGADWDFEDIRDHYLARVFGIDAAAVRHVDRDRYLALSRVLTGEILAEVFGEWRRQRSSCSGALVLWWHDLLPGAGWGLVDHRGRPKAALKMLARVLAPVAVWTTDEHLNGVAVHIANDGPHPLDAQLRVATYRDRAQLVDQATVAIDLAPHEGIELGVEQIIGRFVDAAWAYRFSHPAQDLIVVSLERDGELLSQAMRHPAGWPLEPEPWNRLGATAAVAPAGDGLYVLEVTAERLAYGVRVHAPGFRPSDDCFPVEPGGRRIVTLTPTDEATEPAVRLTAVNASGSLPAGAHRE